VPRKVVITGCGALTAAGSDLASLWAALSSGRTLVGRLSGFSCPEMDALSGAELTVPLSDADHAFRDRCTLMARAAARAAVAHAGLTSAELPRAGLVLGSTMAEERQVADLDERRIKDGPASVDAGFLGRADNHRVAATVAEELGLGGPVWLSATACSSGNTALAWAYDHVADGTADVMLAGGADTFTRSLYCGFSRMSALSKSVCKPFDRNRDGVSFGEGAGIVVLESLEHARARGATVLAEVLGYGLSNDAYHVTAPEPNGAGFARAIAQALATTKVSPESVGYVCAHGTGTPYNDQGEVRALKAVFGERAAQIPLSSIKATLGHTNGAAAAIATIACTLALVHQSVPPTATLVEPDPEFGMDFVVGSGRPVELSTCLNMSAGFGGANACVLLGRAP
jgi:3-oxoacyl-[acyl-carrier-protein] synthase II